MADPVMADVLERLKKLEKDMREHIHPVVEKKK